jgi:Flp pilus assembly protein TadG
MRFSRRMRRAARGERGAVTVELALSLFLLLPLMFATFNYAYYFWIAITTTEAAQLATRIALTNGTTPMTSCPTSLTVPTLATQQTLALTAAQNYINARTGLSTSYVTLPATVTVNGTLTTNNTCRAAAPFGWVVQLQVDFPPIAPMTLPFMPQSATAGRTRYRTKTFVLPP